MASVYAPRRSAPAIVALLVAALVAFAPAAAQEPPTPTPLPLFDLPDPQRNPSVTSNTMALARDNQTLAVANMLNNSVTILVPLQGRILGEVAVGLDPRGIAMTPDDTRILTANRGDNTLSVVSTGDLTLLATISLGGALPYGVVAASNDLAYVSMQGSDEVVAVDLNAGRVTARIPVGDAPGGLALWGDFLYVTHLWNGSVSMVYPPQGRVAAVVSTGVDTGLSQAIEPDILRGVAYLPQTRSNAQNRVLTFDTTVFPVVNVIDLRTLELQPQNRITLDTADRPVNMPFAIAFDRFREWLYVANAGTNDVTVFDLNSGETRAHIEVGANPRGILLSHDSTRLYVHNVLDATIDIINTSSLEIEDELPVSDIAIPNDILIGAQLFHSADDPRLTTDGWISCANCHFDGLPDGRAWAGFPDGIRNTPALYGLNETAPYNRSGTWDELADVELKIRWLQSGGGLIEDAHPFPALEEANAGLSPDLDTLAAYLVSLPAPQSPLPADAEQAARGAAVFAAQECADCHVGQVGTNLQPFDVGTGGAFDTPSLRWLWLSAPYFHDGSAATLGDVFALPGEHQLIYEVSPEDIDALIAYLLSLPQADVPR